VGPAPNVSTSSKGSDLDGHILFRSSTGMYLSSRVMYRITEQVGRILEPAQGRSRAGGRLGDLEDDSGAGGRAGIREGGVFEARRKDELILTFSDDVIDDVIHPLLFVSFTLIEGICRTNVPGAERDAPWRQVRLRLARGSLVGVALRSAACAATRCLAAAMPARRSGFVVRGLLHELDLCPWSPHLKQMFCIIWRGGGPPGPPRSRGG